MDVNKFIPTGKLSRRHLISLATYTEEDVYEILHKATEISKILAVGEKPALLKNKRVALITKNGFTRPRIAFETAVSALSGTATVCKFSGSELESLVKDKLSLAAIVGYGINALVVQTSELKDAEFMEKLVDLPVINANEKCGPCEALSALLAVWRKKGRLDNMKIAMIGAPSAYADSFVYAFSTCGFDVNFICPSELAPSEDLLNKCRQYGDAEIFDNVEEGIKDADVIFVSDDGLPASFRLDEEKMSYATKDPCVLHTLPVSDEVISEEIVSSPAFLGLQEALCLPEIEMAALSLLLAK